MNETEEYRNFVTIALTQIKGDLEKVIITVEKNENWLKKLNNRVRKNEVTISWIKGIGTALTTIFIVIAGWFKLGE
jgi:Trk-type K+ transport system membrane component|tara:strand:- start:337 stop:564 length:228 start_codon:yes stop_codon:yes gene_type:complete